MVQCRLTLSGFSPDPRHQCLRLGRRLQLVLPLQLPSEALVGAPASRPVAHTLQQENQAAKRSLVGGTEGGGAARCLGSAGSVPLSLPRDRQRPARPPRPPPAPPAPLLQ